MDVELGRSLFLFAENMKNRLKAIKELNICILIAYFLDKLLFFFSIIVDVPFGMKKKCSISNGGLYDETQRTD